MIRAVNPAYLAAMNRQAGIKTLFIFFFIIVAFLGIKTVSFLPASVTATIKTETLAHQSKQNPHSELEGTHFHFITAGHTLIQKNVVPFYQLPVSVFYNSSVSLANFQIRKSSLLIKDYLFHIYPSHNFW
jgi:hypothetical protein